MNTKRNLLRAMCAIMALVILSASIALADEGKKKKKKREPKAKPPASQYAGVKYNWEPMYKGIWHAYIEHGGQQMHAIKIKAKSPGISFVVSPVQAKVQNTLDFLNEHHCVVAVNANFFLLGGTGAVLGLAVNDGNVVSGPDGGFTSFIIKKNGKKEVRVVPPNEDVSDIKYAVSGDFQIVKDGFPQSDTSSHHGGRHPRTAIGCSKKGDFIYLLVIDGRQRQSSGVPLSELAQWMIHFGAYNAVNLDGGGSTVMAYRDKDGTGKVLNHPSTGNVLRRVGNSFGVCIQEGHQRRGKGKK